MSSQGSLTEPAKLLLLCTLLAKDRIISCNSRSFLKELVLRRDARLASVLERFESRCTADATFLETLHELIEEESHILFDELFADTSLEVGKMLSKTQREELQLSEEKSLIYGEVDYPSFYRILRKINARSGAVFYDLGSGTGKAIFAARLTQDFSKCIGLELLSDLNSRADMIVDRFNSDYKQYLSYGQANECRVYNCSLLNFDWSDGDVVFANSTCFDDELMQSLSDQAESLKPGAIVVTFTKGLSSKPKTFELLEKKRYKMSWGPATVFIHRRLRADGSPVGPPALNTLPSDKAEYDAGSLDDEISDEDDVEDDQEVLLAFAS